jgi:hypothetical protein
MAQANGQVPILGITGAASHVLMGILVLVADAFEMESMIPSSPLLAVHLALHVGDAVDKRSARAVHQLQCQGQEQSDQLPWRLPQAASS